MARRSAERLKAYLELITRKNGLESVIESVSPAGGLESTAESKESAAARSGLESVRKGREPTPEEELSLEALIIPKLRPAIDIVDGKFNVTHELWTHLSTNAAIRDRIEATIPSIGRIELPGNSQYPYGGTGFVVGDGLLMTNRHVAAIFSTGLGNRNLAFKSGYQAGIDFERERGRPAGTTLMVRAGGDDPSLLGHGDPRGRGAASNPQAAQIVSRRYLRFGRPRDRRDWLSGIRSAQRPGRAGQVVRQCVWREAAPAGTTPRTCRYRKLRQGRIGRGTRLFDARWKLRIRGGGPCDRRNRGATFRRPLPG